MSASCDHAGKAREILTTSVVVSTDAELIAVAQVHATLALVEQQRIANILAAAHLPGDVFDHEKMRDIREGLGL